VRLKNKVALVTGSVQGIGRGIALRVAREGLVARVPRTGGPRHRSARHPTTARPPTATRSCSWRCSGHACSRTARHSSTAFRWQTPPQSLWPVLTRTPRVHPLRGSLLPLPHPYVVPGGRFTELYYWDSHFTMPGLADSGCVDLLHAMTDNFAYLIETYGHVPNGTRTYYLSRSQRELKSQPDSAAALRSRYTSGAGRPDSAAVATSSRHDSSRGVGWAVRTRASWKTHHWQLSARRGFCRWTSMPSCTSSNAPSRACAVRPGTSPGPMRSSGLRANAAAHYGNSALAQEIRARWLETVSSVFLRESKLVEKYALRRTASEPPTGGGGGEYPLQDGFGWTNGVTRTWLE
jgi:hypothetical protein